MNDPRINELRQLLPQAMLPDWVRLGLRASRLFRDRLHPEQHDQILNRLLAQARASVAARQQRRINVPQVSYPPELPITARKDEIVAAIRANQVVVIAGETGSGKTTQIPKMCLEAGLGIAAKIGCTQPRRVAALSISQRIAEELNVAWGRQVGCKIRFDDRSSAETYIKLMTDGILLAEAQGDPQLSDYDCIIIDEAHERSLNIDLLLGHLKGLLARRNDLKVIVTSATIDTQLFSRHFGNAPIIEVSGRLYPVEVIYQPQDAESEEQGDVSYVDAATQAAERVLYESSFGDVLIFMPGERDIREVSDQLEGRFANDAEIIPLFGRLSSGEQQRVFAPSARRKIVIATNIAETSLTIPGIRYVIDAGLARISRYNPRTRTRRLPIEPVSQSSANQRKGRAGRVQDGICIRLYSEEDFNARSPFTQPEIQRANLAEVILRMKAFGFGDIETFAFVQPPSPAAIASGYMLLQELGALEVVGQASCLSSETIKLQKNVLVTQDAQPDRQDACPTTESKRGSSVQLVLTDLGRNLARLPIDPTLGRMLLQSQTEHAPRELLIIAAGLSIQDPRERPLDQKDAAAAAHKRFADPQSDYLALLNIWNAVHDEWEKLRTQGQRRRFCKQHFLSYLRMREWQDLHAQLCDVLADLPLPVGRGEGRGEGAGKPMAPESPGAGQQSLAPTPLPQSLSPSDGARAGGRRSAKSSGSLNESNAAYDAIHRSILSGLIGHVARREERNVYKASGNREVMVFPGSALFERGEKPLKGRDAKPLKNAPPKPKTNQPQWIVAGEIVETSQLFARTIAGIDPQWIFLLAPHCCKVTHQNPHWNVGAGRVLVDEIVTLHGLEVQRSRVAYGNINAQEATAIFIRAALVEEDVLPRSSRREEAPSEKRKAESWKAEISDSLLTSAATGERELPSQYRFLARNRAVRQKIEALQTRVRHHGLIDLDQALCDFYAQRMENISSLDELNRLLRDRVAAGILPAGEPGILPGGKTVESTVALERPDTSIAAGASPGGKMSPSRSGKMPDTTKDAQSFLCAAETDLLGELQLNYDITAFPDAVQLADQPMPLRYAYAPGEEWDGVTVQLPVELASSLSASAIEWSVPGLRAEQVGELLRSLPKGLRRELQPIEPKVIEIVRELQPTGDSLSADVGRFIFRRYGIMIPPDAWRTDALPAHLRPRVEVVDGNRKPIAAGRSLEQLQAQLKDVKAAPGGGNDDWRRATAKWERTAISGWTFGDVPERITVSGEPEPLSRPSATLSPSDGERDRERGRPASATTLVYAWPGLVLEEQLVSLRLFRSRDLAREASVVGVGRLIELAIQKDLGWLQKDLRALSQLKDLYAPIGSHDELLESAFAHLKRYALPAEPLPELTQAAFNVAVAQTRERLRGLPSQLATRLTTILQLRQQVVARLGATATPSAGRARALTDLSQLGQAAAPRARHPLAVELDALLPAQFLEEISFERLTELPRYLKALLTRIERAAVNPPKDQERARQLVPYQEAVNRFRATPPKSAEGRRQVAEFRWLVEEFKVSLFAQELGTAVPVSAKRLEQQLEQLKLIG